ncbi:hypothetical protein NM688_g93 [Phlebia brevispora]|uniref:Uncharacterized protein n=1 Tax=Phlebia brevispora TaxID=194682 RepID=A0ACC1TF63_9APHY|nr:hypothetical protein NM688_g93 [Phlebia brevispora]
MTRGKGRLPSIAPDRRHHLCLELRAFYDASSSLAASSSTTYHLALYILLKRNFQGITYCGLRMSTIVDVSSKLGEYMLKGWVLTDKICQKCGKVPLMRSPSDSSVYFCANCDGDPSPSSSRQAPVAHPQPHAETTSEGGSTASMDFTSRSSRPSTPLTEMSSALSSPTFAPPVDTAEILRRRQQSDTASAEIGKRLLKGWAMLADECPNSGCYGIPLVRPPKSGPEKDPHQVDNNGSQRLVPFEAAPPPSSSAGRATTEAYSSTRNEQAEQLVVRQRSAQLPVQAERNVQGNPAHPSGLSHTLDETAVVLEHSMRSLKDRLNFFSSGNNVDAVLIGQTADAISKVVQALMSVKELNWSERQALGS